MVKKAVLIGVNYPGTQAELHGCVNDVKRMYAVLVERYGFEESSIKVLIDTDAQYTQPTGANIRQALSWLVDGVEEGDVLFIHYSGHGTRVPAETGEQDDTGYDECIVPCDMNLITDEDFRELVNKVPVGASLTIVSDSCHSGGLIEHELEQIGDSSNTDGGSGSRGVGGGGNGGLGDALFGMVSSRLQSSLQKRGINFPGWHHRGHGQEEQGQDEPLVDGSKSKSLPLELLTQILSERTGQQVDVGNIRTTLFDMFGEDSSGKIKTFINVALQQLQSGEGGGQGGVIWGLAQQFLQTKLNDQGEDYVKPAADRPTDVQAAFAGTSSHKGHPDMGILVSGCESNQTSADANPTGDPAQAYGALSNAIQTLLEQGGYKLTNRELVAESRKLLQQQGFTQTPCLYCSDTNADAYFICEA